MTKALQGINLGGWFVAERWMTPELFAGVRGKGERAIGRELGMKEATYRLTHHRDSFITETDFEWLAKKGFEVVRLPVGYWLFTEAKNYASGLELLDRAFEWAQRHSLQVILDLHGLPGSQNGHDHSGEAGKVRFYKWWNRRKALRVLKMAAERYGHHPALLGVQIINEPTVRDGRDMQRLLDYYRSAARLLDDALAPSVKVIIGDAWRPQDMAQHLDDMPARRRLVLDVHLYQVFSAEDKALSLEQHIYKAAYEWRDLLQDLRGSIPVMVGEWSGALDPRTYNGMSPKQRSAAQRRYTVAQRVTFRETSWCEAYWSYYVPAGGDWSYRKTRPVQR